MGDGSKSKRRADQYVGEDVRTDRGRVLRSYYLLQLVYAYSLDVFLSKFGTMFGSNCCFLTCLQISQEVGKLITYSHLFKNFPQFIVIHTVKGIGIVNKAEIDVFLELSHFFHDPADVGNLTLVPLLF